MAKFGDFINFYKKVTENCNEKFDDKVPPFLCSVSIGVSQAEISITRNEIKSYTQLRKNFNFNFRTH